MSIRGHPSFYGVYDMLKQLMLFQYLGTCPVISAVLICRPNTVRPLVQAGIIPTSPASDRALAPDGRENLCRLLKNAGGKTIGLS